MTPRLTVLPEDTPDDIDLDLLELGAVTSPDDRARIGAARTGDLAVASAELAEARAFFAEHAPPLPRAHRTWSSYAWRAAPLVALAALALLVLRILAAPDPGEPLRPMGGLGVDLQVERTGAVVDDPRGFLAADRLVVGLRSPRDGFLDVWTRQADGSISPLVVGRPVGPGESVTLGIELDDYAGEEWLMMRVTDQPSTAAQLAPVEPDDLPRGASRIIEVTRRP